MSVKAITARTFASAERCPQCGRKPAPWWAYIVVPWGVLFLPIMLMVYFFSKQHASNFDETELAMIKDIAANLGTWLFGGSVGWAVLDRAERIFGKRKT